MDQTDTDLDFAMFVSSLGSTCADEFEPGISRAAVR